MKTLITKSITDIGRSDTVKVVLLAANKKDILQGSAPFTILYNTSIYGEYETLEEAETAYNRGTLGVLENYLVNNQMMKKRESTLFLPYQFKDRINRFEKTVNYMYESNQITSEEKGLLIHYLNLENERAYIKNVNSPTAKAIKKTLEPMRKDEALKDLVWAFSKVFYK